MIDVEHEFTRCISKAGGIEITSVVGPSPGFENADYLFPDAKVIAELKCLVEDKGMDPKIQAKASAIYDDCLKVGDAPKLVFGTVKLTTQGFPEEFTRQIIELYRLPVHRSIEKANKQIRATKEQMGKQEHAGLLLLVNDGHTFLDPYHVLFLLHETFRRFRFSSIDAVVFFTVNLTAQHPEKSQNYRVWILMHRETKSPCSDSLIEQLREAWFAHLASVTGEPVSKIEVYDVKDIHDLSNMF